MAKTTSAVPMHNTPENTQCWEGATHVHAHHKLPDNYVLANPKQPGRCAVEMVCHACGASILIFFFMPHGAREPADADKVFKVRDGFVERHRRCPLVDPTKDYTVFCPRARTSKPEVFDFARSLS